MFLTYYKFILAHLKQKIKQFPLKQYKKNYVINYVILFIGTGGGNRTPVIGFGDQRIATIRHPQTILNSIFLTMRYEQIH